MSSAELDARAAVIDRLFQSMLSGAPDEATFADDLVYEQHFGNTAGVYHGLSGLRRWSEAFDEIWGDRAGRMTNFREAGERVAADFSVVVSGPQSGIEVELRGIAIYEFDADRRVVRFDTYNDEADAEAALRGA